jgi:hypothetical protein
MLIPCQVCGEVAQRFRAAQTTSPPLALASFAFALAIFPLARLLPSDAVACFFRKPAKTAHPG